MSGTENWTESWSGASNRSDVESRLRRIGGQHDAEIDVAAAALLLAALQRPQQYLERYYHHLSLLARDIAELADKQDAQGSLAARVAELNAVLVERYGYHGDSETYEDMSNAIGRAHV